MSHIFYIVSNIGHTDKYVTKEWFKVIFLSQASMQVVFPVPSWLWSCKYSPDWLQRVEWCNFQDVSECLETILSHSIYFGKKIKYFRHIFTYGHSTGKWYINFLERLAFSHLVPLVSLIYLCLVLYCPWHISFQWHGLRCHVLNCLNINC